MTIQEVLKSTSNKKYKRTITSFGPEYGVIMDMGKGPVFHYESNGTVYTMPLSINDLMANDWEFEREIRTFWLGLKIVKFTHAFTGETIIHKILEAVEGPNPPEEKTGDLKPWVKVLEVMEGKSE